MAHPPPILDDAWARRISSGVAAGSRDALGALYTARYEQLFRIVQARTKRDDAFAIDAVHDAWLRVARTLPTMTSLDTLDRWLARAAISAALDRLRSETSRRRREEMERSPRTETDQELIDAMLAELDQLSQADRSVIELRFRRGLSLESLAQALDVGAKAAEIRLRRALARLRDRMAGRTAREEVDRGQ